MLRCFVRLLRYFRPLFWTGPLTMRIRKQVISEVRARGRRRGQAHGQSPVTEKLSLGHTSALLQLSWSKFSHVLMTFCHVSHLCNSQFGSRVTPRAGEPARAPVEIGSKCQRGLWTLSTILRGHSPNPTKPTAAKVMRCNLLTN